MSEIEFRRAVVGDVEEVLRVMAQAFGRVQGSEKYERDKERITRETDAHWVLVREGEIVGAAHVRREEIQVGQAVVAKADVGEVCIAPSCQGEGLGTALMKMVLGLVPVEQVVVGEKENVAMLRAAFPVQGTATGIWG